MESLDLWLTDFRLGCLMAAIALFLVWWEQVDRAD